MNTSSQPARRSSVNPAEAGSARTFAGSARRVRPVRDERGMAMIIALMAMLLMMALGTALILTTTTESRIVGNFRNSSEAMYAADAALERAMNDVLTVSDWNTLISGGVTSAFIDGPPSGVRTLSDGTRLDLSQVLNRANCNKITTCSAADMDAYTVERPWKTNNPRWQLYAYGPINDLLPTGTVNSPYYVVVMVGDDPSENDNNPLADGVVDCLGVPAVYDKTTNSWSCNPGTGVIAMRAEAFGPFGTHRVIEMTVGRTDTTELERGYTGQRGQDEQNRRARKAAVGTPGKSLTSQARDLTSGGLVP